MATATSFQLQQLYIGFFGRPADPAGLSYWLSTQVSQEEFSAQMSIQPEYTNSIQGLSINQQIDAMYVKLFGRNAEAAGLAYWTNLFTANPSLITSLPLILINAAAAGSVVGSPTYNITSVLDNAAITNKATTAGLYTADVLETSASQLAYNPTSVTPWVTGPQFTSAAAFLTSVTATNIPNAAAVQASVDAMTAITPPGQTFTLTTNQDIASAETFVGFVDFNGGTSQSSLSTMNSFDVLSGSSTRTTDSLNIQLENANGQAIGGAATAQVNTYTAISSAPTASVLQVNQLVFGAAYSSDGTATFAFGGAAGAFTVDADVPTTNATNLAAAINNVAGQVVAFRGGTIVANAATAQATTTITYDGALQGAAKVGMTVAVASGTGAFSSGTVITAVTATTITVSAVPSTALADDAVINIGGGVGGVTTYGPSSGATAPALTMTITSGTTQSLITPSTVGNVGATVNFTYGTLPGSYVIGATADATATNLAAALISVVGSGTAVATTSTVTLTAPVAGIPLLPVVFTGTSTNLPSGTTSTANATGSAISFGTNTGLDIVNLSNISGSEVLVSAFATPGATAFRSNLSTNTLTFNNLTQGSIAYLKGNGALTTGGLTASYGSTVTSGVVNLEGGTTAGVITIIGSGLTSQTITSTGASNKVVTVTGAASATSTTINATTALEATGAVTNLGTTLNISGAGSVKIGAAALEASVKTLNATANTGGVTAHLNGNVDIKVTGGTGNDTFTAGAGLTTGSVNAGDGTADELIVGANVSFINTATLAAKYTNFEVLNFGGTYNMSLLPGITAIKLSAASAVTNLTAIQAANITTTSATVATQSLSLADANGTTDVATINLGAGTKDVVATDITSSLTVNGFETLNLKANPGSIAAIGNDRTSIIAAITGDSLTAINLTGTAFSVTNGATANATTINATALTGDGDVKSKGLTLGGSLIAGSSVVGSGLIDTYSIGAISSSYNGGAGSDIFNITQAVLNTTTAFTTIVGGDGSDTLNLTDTGTITYADSNFANVSGIEKFVLGTVAGTGTSFVAGTNLNQLATANGGVWDVAATSIASSSTTNGSVTIDASQLSAGNSLTANVRVAPGANAVAATVITKIFGSTSGKDSITLTTVAAATGSSGSFLVDAATNTAGVTINGSAMADNLTSGSTIKFLGGSGADTITAAAVATSITGGANRDTLIAGAGADNFIYTSAVTSIGQANVDNIINFASSADKIVLMNGVLAGVTLISGTTVAATALTAATSSTSVNSIADVYAAIASNTSYSASNFAGSAAAAGSDQLVSRIITFSEGSATGTYLVVNDAVAGFQAASDFIAQIGSTSTATTYAAGDLIAG